MVSEHFQDIEHDHHLCIRCEEGPYPELNYGLCTFCEQDIRESPIDLLREAWFGKEVE